MNTEPEGGRIIFVTVLPAAVVTGIAAVLVGLVAYVSDVSLLDIDQPIVLALVAAAMLTFAVLIWGWSLASFEARKVAGRYATLQRSASRARADLASAQEELAQREAEFQSLKRRSADALRSVAGQAALGEGDGSGRDLQVEVFVTLARRLQSLVHRGIETLDQLENEVEDPDLLKGLFQVDHLATRVRRYTENLAVLGGAVPHRQWSRPVSVSIVLRSAIAEVEHYSRVKLVPPVPGTIRGHAVADLIHLVAELAENATLFSPPQTKVLLRVERVTAGLAIEVEDRGLGMRNEERSRLNALLASPEHAVPAELLRDGRIGLYVVSWLARRHGVAVQLQGNIYGGTQAVMVLPLELLGGDDEEPAQEPVDPEPRHRDATADTFVSRNATPTVRNAATTVQHEPAALPAAAGSYPPGPEATAPLPVAPSHTDGPVGPSHTDGAVPLPDRRGVHAQEVSGNDVDTSAYPVLQPGSAAHPQNPEDPRPVLPRRRRQEHLAPELREPSQVASELEDVEHNPRLMAAFRAGFRMGEDFSGSDTSPDPGWEPQPRSQ